MDEGEFDWAIERVFLRDFLTYLPGRRWCGAQCLDFDFAFRESRVRILFDVIGFNFPEWSWERMHELLLFGKQQLPTGPKPTYRGTEDSRPCARNVDRPIWKHFPIKQWRNLVDRFREDSKDKLGIDMPRRLFEECLKAASLVEETDLIYIGKDGNEAMGLGFARLSVELDVPFFILEKFPDVVDGFLTHIKDLHRHLKEFGPGTSRWNEKEKMFTNTLINQFELDYHTVESIVPGLLRYADQPTRQLPADNLNDQSQESDTNEDNEVQSVDERSEAQTAFQVRKHRLAYCTECDDYFQHASSLNRHKPICRGKPAKDRFRCLGCQTQFATWQAFNAHQPESTCEHLTPKRMQYCEICDRFFNSIANLKKHRKGHHT